MIITASDSQEVYELPCYVPKSFPTNLWQNLLRKMFTIDEFVSGNLSKKIHLLNQELAIYEGRWVTNGIGSGWMVFDSQDGMVQFQLAYG